MKTEEQLIRENKELKERIQLYEETMDKVIQGIFICDPDEKVIWFNDAVQINDGISRKEGLGKHQKDTWKHLELPNTPTDFTIQTGEQSKEEFVTYKDKNTGNEFTVFNNSYPFYSEGKLKYVYSIAYYMGYTDKQFTKVAEYRQKYLNHHIRVMNNTRYSLEDVVGSSPVIKEITAKAKKIAPNKTPVMLVGETGTGKEIFAQGIHNASISSNEKFVAINCAAIPDTLLESTLFGTVKGAFTGATDKAGLLEEAKDGTLFLDELNSMPLMLQGKLLRVLQEKQAYRIGSNKPYPVHFRLISATNKDPRQLVKSGLLRSDLYFRLAVLILELPPLCTRGSDVIELTNHFIQKYNREYGMNIKEVSHEVYTLFLKYDWPGNVRELDNAIEYTMNFALPNDAKISVKDLPTYLKDFYNSPQKKHISQKENQKSLKEILDLTEKEFIEAVLKETNWNISRAAKILDIHREALYYRIKKFGLKRPEKIL